MLRTRYALRARRARDHIEFGAAKYIEIPQGSYRAAAGCISTAAALLLSRKDPDRSPGEHRRAGTAGFVDILGKCVFECDIRFTLKVWQIISLAVSAAVAFIKIKTNLEVKNNVREQNQ